MRLRTLSLLVAGALGIAACGGDDADQDSEGERTRARKAALMFVAAVREGDTDKQCRVLIKGARKAQGCGNAGADIGPTFALAVQAIKSMKRDVKVVALRDGVARVALPDCELGKDFGPPPKNPQPVILVLERVQTGAWKVARFAGSIC